MELIRYNNMGRGLAYKNHQRDRIIKKRTEIVKQWYIGMEDLISEPSHYLKEPGRMVKFNLNCGCKTCHYYKHVGNSKSKYSHKERCDRL